MTNQLSKHFKARRLELGLGLSELARLAGYKNLSKGANRILAFENGGAVHPDLLAKLGTALAINKETVEQIIEEDRRQFLLEWNEWADEPITPHLVLRLMAAIYHQLELPEDVRSAEEAEVFASGVARKHRLRCCLVLSRRLSVWFNETGSVENRTEAVPGEPNSPCMWIGGSRRAFVLNTLSEGDFIRRVTWPLSPGPQS